MIPKEATHKWTPAEDVPMVDNVFRRIYYRKVGPTWFSYSLDGHWLQSKNDQSWFNAETELGYFVEINKGN